MIRRVIDREQVLHVARLARLELTDEEVEKMASELSGILEHVERINQLDLEKVEPTSHVVAIENVLRPDTPRPSPYSSRRRHRRPPTSGRPCSTRRRRRSGTRCSSRCTTPEL